MRARTIIGVSVFFALLLLNGVVSAQSQQALLEYQVKTSYLYNFMQFVRWPEGAFDASGKFNLCVVTGEHYDAALNAVSGEHVDGHEIVVHRFDSPELAAPVRCHIMFITRDKLNLAPATFNAAHGVLTISDAPEFLERGGIINLVEVRGKIRFEINQQAALRAGLVISSKVLELSMRLL